ncbi:hypothetical protein SJ05684_c21630 [Sinorhizobium sojae CCBAU 05684]|uniref:Uncharacterized protein n=1 Tax=Sinorhizobium sojae CCBAU 05684 TaxID=716928 RepID=A0A249PD61_9HYPH|nr:hypothetical protein [Sinorhizobium sojae]ASY63604.1 hypothetical protein SJ05684_c21630 [Sinorhizobium sojae CCBAU 05684]
MKNVTTIEKAKAAKRLQENEDFKLIMRSIEDDIFATFKAVNIGEAEKLSNVHALSHGFKLVNDRIAKYIELAIFEARKEEISDE